MSKHTFYSGVIRHRRFEPTSHEFDYKLFMFCLDLDDLHELFNFWPLTSLNKPALGRFKRKDHIGSKHSSLKNYVLDQVYKQIGIRPNGRVTLLTHIRMWGILMNPIAVFSCYDKGENLQAVVLQVTNTPWGEQCMYILKAEKGAPKQHFEFSKKMHVSPFHPMDMHYRCHYMLQDGKLVFHLENHKNKHCLTDATLIMQGKPLTRKKLIKSIFLYPYMTSKVYYGIYKQAFSLFIKRNPIYTNPQSAGKQEKYSQGT